MEVLGAKDPGAALSYQMDWSAYFTALDDTLDSASVEVVDANGAPITSDLEVVSMQATGTGIVTFWLAGGTAGERYRVRCTVRGASLEPAQVVDMRTVIVPIREG